MAAAGPPLPTLAPAERHVVRGIYDADEDPDFDGAVRSFATKDESEAWYATKQRCTNPDYPQCRHIYTTLCDWEQVNKYLLRPLAEYRAAYPVKPADAGAVSGNVFVGEAVIRRELTARLDLPFHARTTEESTLNTLRYMFYHMKCGIFAMVRRNRVVMFVPFVNKDYTNTWAHKMTMEYGSVEEFARHKIATLHTREEYIPDVSRWWANGNIICNVDSPSFWGDSYLTQLKDMLVQTCATRTVPDCEFFINKRDFPHLKRNLTEPYDFIYDRDDEPLSRELYASYAPILSFFVGREFADLPFVTTDDWETATGQVFPPGGTDLRSAAKRKSHEYAWEKRQATAFFRGQPTGPGTDADTNQRIRLATLSAQWASKPEYSDGNPVDGVQYLDAGVVGWSARDRKQQGRPMTFIKPATLGISKVERVEMYKQMRYKYHVYVDGHCAAMRYASMMPLGAVILRVASVTKADSMWFFPLLRPYDIHSSTPDPLGDHIMVADDLSDLADVITWCKTHDAECAAIASNSKALYERLISKDGQLDYMQLVLHEIAARFTSQEAAAGAAGTSSSGGAAAAGTVAGGAASASASAASASAGAAAPSSLMPALSAPPLASDDWFGADNRAYVETCIGPSAMKPPVAPALATHECECPACAARRATAALAASASRSAADASTGAGGATAASSFSGPAASAASAAAAAAARLVNPAATAASVGPKLVMNDKLKAALAARAALAKQKAGSS